MTIEHTTLQIKPVVPRILRDLAHDLAAGPWRTSPQEVARRLIDLADLIDESTLCEAPNGEEKARV